MSEYLIEFVGGPFDGHRQHVSLPPDHLAPHVALPVSAGIFRLIEGQQPPKNTPLTSIAFYRRDISERVIQYRYVASSSPQKVHIEG